MHYAEFAEDEVCSPYQSYCNGCKVSYVNTSDRKRRCSLPSRSTRIISGKSSGRRSTSRPKLASSTRRSTFRVSRIEQGGWEFRAPLTMSQTCFLRRRGDRPEALYQSPLIGCLRPRQQELSRAERAGRHSAIQSSGVYV